MNGLIAFLNAAGRAFVSFALPMLIQSSVLILILLLVDLALRRRVRAVLRYWIWMLVLVKLVLPPSLGSPFSFGTWFGDKLEPPATILSERSTFRRSQEPPIAWPPPTRFATDALPGRTAAQRAIPDTAPLTGIASRDTLRPLPESPSVPPTAEAAGVTAPRPPALSWQALVLLIWIAVVSALILLLGQRAFFVRGLIVQGQGAPPQLTKALEQCRTKMGVGRSVALRISPNATSPAVCGLWRPMILIPKSLAPMLRSYELNAVLLHELAHIKRGDLWINLMQTLLQIGYFFHPLLWLANLAIRRIREQAVDETVVVTMGEAADDYPATLLTVARLALRDRPALSLRLIGVVESKNALAARIKHILSRPVPKSAKLGFLSLAALFLIAAVLLPMAKARPKTERAANVMILAGQEARRLNHSYIGTEHILLALARQKDAVSTKALANLGIDIDTLRAEVDKVVRHGSAPVTKKRLPHMPRVKNVVTYAKQEAQRFGHDYIGTEHILLGLMQESEGIGAQILARLKVTEAQVRTEVLTLVRSGRQNHQDRTTQPDLNDAIAIHSTLEPPGSPSVTATLPNGVTVELVGLFKGLDGEDRQWWYPDGTPAPEERFASYEKEVNWAIAFGDPDTQFEYGYLLHFDRGKGLTARAGASVGRQFGGYSQDKACCIGYICSKRGDRWEGFPEVGAIKVAAAINGPYETVEIDFNTLKQRDVFLAAGNKRVMIALPRNWRSSRNGTLITAATTADTLDMRLRYERNNGAVDTAECVSIPEQSGLGPDRIALPHHFSIHTSPDNFRHILVDYRPAGVARFDSVSLKPGGKTNTQAYVWPHTEGTSPAPTGPSPLGRYALSFDGIDDCLVAPASPSLTLKPPFTIEVWARPDLPVSEETESVTGYGAKWIREHYVTFIGQGEYLADASGIPARRLRSTLAGGFLAFIRPGLGHIGSVFKANEKGQLSQVGLFRQSPLELDRFRWMHLAINLFSDGNYVPAPHGDLVIGGTTIPGMGSFKGQIAEIRVWNRSLSDEETRYYGNSPLTGNEPGLVACWDFERRPGGQIVYDISPNANHAHLGQSIGPDNSDPRWIDLEEEPADETVHEERWDMNEGFNIYLLANEEIDLDTATTIPLGDLVLSDRPWIAAENIERYDWSTHTIYLKDAVKQPIRQIPLKGMPFVVVADGRRCYLGALWSWISSYMPTYAVPLIYGMHTRPRDRVTIDWLSMVTPNGEPPFDEREDQRVYDTLVKYGQWHGGLLVSLDQVEVSPANGASSIRYTYTVSNDDSDDLLVLDPDKMGADLFHYFHNGPSLRAPGEQAIGPRQADPATIPKELDLAWLSRLASGESHTWTVTRDGYPPIAPGSYECRLRFPGPGPLATQAQRTDTETRIWLGQIDARLEITIPEEILGQANAATRA